MLSRVSDLPLQIHWSSASAAPQPALEDFLRSARFAEQHGLASVHVPVYGSLRQVMEWVAAGMAETHRVSFRLGGDFQGLLEGLEGRALMEVAAEHANRLIVHGRMADSGAHQLDAAKELLANLRALFPALPAPRFDVEGQIAEAAFLAIQRADCLWRLPDAREQVYADALPVLHFGKAVGLTAYVIARENREQAREAALHLLPGSFAEYWRDTRYWKGTCLWTAHEVEAEGAAAIVGSYEEVADAVHGFKACGITQVMLRELRWGRELERFAGDVLPRLRSLESKRRAV